MAPSATELSATLAEGRAEHESLMLDTCRITKPGAGKGPFNETTGKYDAPTLVVVYEGKCRIPSRGPGGSTSGSASTSGEASWLIGEFPLEIPIDGSGYKGNGDVGPGQTVTYLTAAHDATLVGLFFGITEPSRQSQDTARRFKMKQTVGGGS